MSIGRARSEGRHDGRMFAGSRDDLQIHDTVHSLNPPDVQLESARHEAVGEAASASSLKFCGAGFLPFRSAVFDHEP